MRAPRILSCLAALLLPLETLAGDTVDEVLDCMKRNIPKRSSVQTLHFVAVDRIGGERKCGGKVFGIRRPDGLLSSKVCITEPDDARGIQLLSVEQPDRAPDTRIYSPETRTDKPITGESLGGGVCGSDVSYEDLQRSQQLNRPESRERLPDAEVEGRPVYVLAARPLDPTQSAYTKVLSYVDKETCVVIKSESFENGDRLRKVMIAKPDELLEQKSIHVPAHVVVTDERDKTHTTVTADDLEIDGEIDDKNFERSSLLKPCR